MLQDRERVTRALDAVTAGLAPFVERELQNVYKEKWTDYAKSSFRENRGQSILKGSNGGPGSLPWDAHSLLTVMWDQWNSVFRNHLGLPERSLVSELREFRNRWAHQTQFDFDDTYRILDSVERLLKAVDRDQPELKRLSREKQDLMREHFSREARAAYKKSRVAKQKWLDTGVYLACGFSIVLVILQIFSGLQAWVFAGVVMLMFVYFSYLRITATQPVFSGPHECVGCRKIIYGDTCPYCERTRIEVTVDD